MSEQTTVAGCCDSPAADTDPAATSAATPVAGPCCGTTEQARAENACCGGAAKVEAVASGGCGCG